MPQKIMNGKLYDTDQATRLCLLSLMPAVALYKTAKGNYFKCPDCQDRQWVSTMEFWLEPLTKQEACREVVENINAVPGGRQLLADEFGLKVEDA